MAIEKEIIVNQLKKRFDLLIHNKNGDPLMITECKAPTIKLNQNTIEQVLSGVMNPGEIKYWTDASGTNYWGNNILWNPGSFPSFAGWILLLDDMGNIVDFVASNWDAATIASGSINTITGTIFPGSVWTGDGSHGGLVRCSRGIAKSSRIVRFPRSPHARGRRLVPEENNSPHTADFQGGLVSDAHASGSRLNESQRNRKLFRTHSLLAQPILQP